MTARSTGSARAANAVEQREQARVAPAGVVVAEEHRHRRGRRVERRPRPAAATELHARTRHARSRICHNCVRGRVAPCAMAPRASSVGYVLMGFPRVSETFIASELLRVEQAGVPLRLFVVKPVEERERELRHPVVDAIRARAGAPARRGVADHAAAPLAPRRPRAVPARARAASPAAGPRGLARAARHRAAPRRSATAARRFSGPRKIYIKELLQAIALADRLLDAPDVRHLHAHFAHGTTTITWHAARIAGLPFSFTGHARDIYAEHLNPKGWLRRKLLAARFVVTCTEANVAPPARDRAGGGDPPRLPRAERRLRAAARASRRRPRRGNGDACASSPSAATSPRRASTCSSTRAPSCARRGVAFEAAIVGQEDKHSRRGPGAHRRATGSSGHVRLPGPMGQDELLREYRRASALCMPSRLLPDDRDGIPNVLVEAMAAGTPVIASAVSGIPELVEHEVNGLLVAPEDPEALADALLRLHDDPALAAQLAGSGRETVASALRRPAAGRPPRRAVPGGGPRVTSAVARRPRPVLCVTEHEHRSRAIADGVRRGPLHASRARRARCGTDPDWLGAGLPADEEWRIEWVKFALGARPRARRRRTGDPAYQDAVGAADRVVDPPGARRTTTPPRSPRAGSSTGSTRGSGFAADGEHAERAARPASPTRSRTSAPTSRPSATTARSSSTRCSIAALAFPELDDGLLELRGRRARPQPRDRLPPRRRPPRGLDALPRDRAALVRRRARERPPLRARAAARLRRAARPRVRVRAPTARRPDGTIPALSDADTGDYALLPRDLLATRLRSRPRARGRTRRRELPRRRLLRAAQRLGAATPAS